MANEEREFSFSTQRKRLGEDEILLANKSNPLSAWDIDTSQNATFSGGVIGPNYSTTPDSAIDRFEWGGPISDNYDELAGGEGGINTNAPVVEGSYSLKYLNEGSFGGLRAISYPNKTYPGGGLANYPQPGDKIGGYVYTRYNNELGRLAEARVNFAAVEGETSWYQARFDGQDNQINLTKWATGTETALNTASVTFTQDEWYYVEIDYSYDSGSGQTTIKATLYETDASNKPILDNPIQSVTATDGEPRLQDNGGGGFGFSDVSTYVSIWDDFNLNRGGSEV